MDVRTLEEREKQIQEKIQQWAENQVIGDDVAPIFDGIYSAEKYLNAPCRVLWVLKEPYDYFDENGNPVGGGWSFADGFENPINFAKGRTGSVVTYASYGILHDMLWNDMPYVDDNPEIAKSVQEIAYINLSKMPAYKSTSSALLWEKLDKWLDIVLEQIKRYEPQVVIFGGTFNYLRQHLLDESLGVAPELEGCVKSYDLGDQLFIEAYHPSYWVVGKENYINSIILAVRKWKNKPKQFITSEKKYEIVAKIAHFLRDNQMVMTGGSLADLFNANEIWTSYGTYYAGGRGTYTLIRNAYHYFADNDDEKTAKCIADAFINANGIHAWE